MKQTDMRVGQEYAHRRSRAYGRGDRVKLLQKGIKRTVGWGRTSNRADGVKVAFINAKGEEWREDEVPSSQIVSTWKAEQARIVARDEAHDKQQVEREKAAERLTAAREALGLIDHYGRMGVEQLEHFGALLAAARKVVNAPLQQAKVLDDLREAIYTFDFR